MSNGDNNKRNKSESNVPAGRSLTAAWMASTVAQAPTPPAPSAAPAESRPGPEVFAPKRREPSVEDAVAKTVKNDVLKQDPAKSSHNIIRDHFIQRGENIANEMEAQAVYHDARAVHFRKLRDDARKSAKIQADAAAAHEDRMQQIENLLIPPDEE